MSRYRITTPEQVHFHYETAGLMSRAMAWTVDQLLLWVGRIAAVIAFAGFGQHLGATLAILGIFGAPGEAWPI